MQEWGFTADRVTKRYGADAPPANDDVTIRLEPGAVYGLTAWTVVGWGTAARIVTKRR